MCLTATVGRHRKDHIHHPRLIVICFSSRTGGGKAVLARAVVPDVLPEGDRPGVRLGRRHLQERLRHAQEDLQPRCVSLAKT